MIDYSRIIIGKSRTVELDRVTVFNMPKDDNPMTSVVLTASVPLVNQGVLRYLVIREFGAYQEIHDVTDSPDEAISAFRDLLGQYGYTVVQS